MIGMESETSTVWPPHKYALQKLKETEKLAYGQIITWELLQSLINRGPIDEWPFRGEYMELCRLAKEEGFLLSQTSTNGEGVRVLSREEMATAVHNREASKANDSLRNSLMLSRVPKDGLSEKEVRKIEHWETKAAIIGAASKHLLKKRSLPSPEMVIKSLRQTLCQ